MLGYKIILNNKNYMGIFRFIKRSLAKVFYSKQELAKKAGVIMGDDNFIASYFWSSEPYLITVGSHCQITEGVHIFTHGGGQCRKG